MERRAKLWGHCCIQPANHPASQHKQTDSQSVSSQAMAVSQLLLQSGAVPHSLSLSVCLCCCLNARFPFPLLVIRLSSLADYPPSQLLLCPRTILKLLSMVLLHFHPPIFIRHPLPPISLTSPLLLLHPFSTLSLLLFSADLSSSLPNSFSSFSSLLFCPCPLPSRRQNSSSPPVESPRFHFLFPTPPTSL